MFYVLFKPSDMYFIHTHAFIHIYITEYVTFLTNNTLHFLGYPDIVLNYTPSQ